MGVGVEMPRAPRTATAIINSHLIRTSRMLAQMARVLGQDKDKAGYDAKKSTGR